MQVLFGLFPVRQFTAVSKSRLCCSWLQYFAHVFGHAGKGITEHIVRQTSLLSMRILHMYFAAQEKELPLNNSYSFTFGPD